MRNASIMIERLRTGLQMDVAHPEASISTEISSIPVQRFVQALFDAVGGGVGEVAGGFGDVGDGVERCPADLTGALGDLVCHREDLRCVFVQ